MTDPNAPRYEDARLAGVEAAWPAPSLYDEALRPLARRGLALPASGTSGTSGMAYLRRMLEVALLPELWPLPTDL